MRLGAEGALLYDRCDVVLSAYERVPGRAPARQRPRTRTDAAPAPLRLDDLSPDGVLALQETAGNRAVTGMLARRELLTPGSAGGVLQRENGDGEGGVATAEQAPPQQAGGGGAGGATPFLADAALRRTEQMRANAASRVGSIALFDMQASQAFRVFRPKRLNTSRRYRNAYRAHVRVLQAARSDAEFQNMITGVVVGAAASVVIAFGVAALAPTVAAASAFSAVGAVNIVGQATAASAGGTAVSSLLATDTSFDPVGSEDRDELDAWRTIAELYARAREVSILGARLGNHLGNTEYAIGQVRSHLRGGADADMDWATTLDMVSSLMRIDEATARLDETVPRAREGFAAFAAAATTMEVPTEDELEKNVWVVWMAQLPDSRSDLLDRDAVENHLHRIGVLGSGSILGVDFGMWTSEDDELAALAAARREARRLEDEADRARRAP